MRKARILSAWSCLFLCTALAHAAQPTIIFSDLQSGPNTGGRNNQGAIVTVYGLGFGATQGSSTLTVGGVAPAAYLQWSDSKISFQIGNAAVTGTIVVKVAGVGSSNGISFRVRPGRIFFVGTTGSDSNSGTFSSPWRTVRHAKDSAQAGDVIYLMNGINETALDASGATLAIGKSGTAGYPIAMVAYPGAAVTIGSATGQLYGIRTTATANYWVLAGINLRGAFSAIIVSNSFSWRVISSDISCPNGSGSGACVAFSASKNVFLYRNRIHDNGSTAATNIRQYHSVWFSGASSTIDLGWNEIGNTRSCTALQFYSTGASLYSITVRNNLIHDARCDGINFGSIDPAFGTVRAYNNVIYRVGTGPAPGGVEAHYTCVNVGGTGSARVPVMNNTLYDCGRRANGDSGAISASAPVSMIDNIVRVLSGESYIAPNSSSTEFTGSNNLFYGDGAAPSFSTASVHADPGFVDVTNGNFQLQSTSQAIDRGANDGISRDISQTPRPQGLAYDIGGYEYAGAVTQAKGILTVAPLSLSFGNVVIGSSASQAVTLSNSSGTAVTINGVTTSGTGFSRTSPSLPLTLASGQSSTLTVIFAPQATGTVSGALQITTNASNSSITVSLAGSGVTVQHLVNLGWTASTSTVAGYNVYRGTASGGPYKKLNATPAGSSSFTDNTVSSGVTYYYVVTAVASNGAESTYSNQTTAVIPSP